MQDEYDRIYRSYSRKPAPPSAQDNEDEYDAIYLSARKVAPPAPAAPEKMGHLEKTWENLKGFAANPAELILSPLRDFKANFSPVQGTKYRPSDKFGAPGGAFDRLPDGTIITKENTPNSITAEEAKQAGINTGINAITGSIPGLGKVGQRLVAAGTGAYYDKEDRIAGALTGLIAGEVIPRVATLGVKATGAAARAAARPFSPLNDLSLDGVTGRLDGSNPADTPRTPRRVAVSSDAPTEKALAKLEEAAAKTEKKLAEAPIGSKQSTKLAETAAARRALAEKARLAVERRKASTLPALKETPVNDLLLIQEEAARVAATERTLQGINDSVVRPGAARAPAAEGSFPEGYTATADKPLPEVSALPGQKPIIDPEVKASRVADERLATAEQREAERLMTKEVKAIDKEAADEAAAAIADAEKAAKQAQKDTEKATKTLTQEKAKAAREAEKAALTADRAAQAAAKAAKLQADAAALEAAKAVGKDAVKEVRAQQAAEKAAQRAADAQAKADFAAQAALDAQAKRALADEAAAKTVADMTPPSTETAAGMLNTANAQYNRTQRGKMAAQAALARRKPLNVAPVADQVKGVPVASVAPIAPLDAPVAPLAAPLTPSNAPAIPRGGSARAKSLADEYNATRPDYKDELPRVEKVDEEFAKKVAAWYDGAKSTADDPATAAAYRALANETRQQAEFLKSKGVRFEYVTEDPYPNSAAMMEDVEKNGVLKVFKTPDDFQHPLLTPEENDLFRAIHDFFGHAKEGHQFGPKGEENAYRVHSSMFSPEARKAMATETRGQNSWVNYGPYGEANRANPKETRFAEQKTTLMPDELMGDYMRPGTPSSMAPADKPFLNWRTLGVDPSKPDVLNKSVSARIQEKMRDPAFVDEMRAARGSTTFGAMNDEAMKSKFIKDFVADPASLDPKKVARLSGAEIAAIKPLLRENVALIESISRELQDGNLSADDIALAHQKIDMLEEANANTLLVIQQEGSARGRDLGALRQVANMTTDPAYWLMKAQKMVGGETLGSDVMATIVKLAKEAGEACGGG